MKRREAVVITVLFALLLVLPLVITLASPKKSFLEFENKSVDSFSKIVKEKSVLSGEFGRAFEDWFSQNMVGRERLVKLKRRTDAVLGVFQTNGVIIGENELFNIPKSVDEEVLANNILQINLFANKFSGNKTFILVPSAADVFPDSLPSLAPKTKESEVVNRVYSSVKGVETLDVYKALHALSYNEAFYRTDHHWTSRGAAEVYKAWMGEREFEFETVSESFFGTIVSTSAEDMLEPDKIEKIKTGERFSLTTPIEHRDSMYYDFYLDKKDKYSYFLGTNKPLVILESDVDTGRVLLVFKDSYAHTFAQCLADDFDKVILVDPRYINAPLSTLVDLSEVTDTLFLFSTEVMTTVKFLGFMNL